MLKRMLLLIVIVLGLLPTAALAQEANDDEPYDTLVRVKGPVHIAAGETAQGVIVISDNAVIDGHIHFLLVIGGDATITGTVDHSVIMVDGTLTLANGAFVGEDVQLYNADVIRDAGATVTGDVLNEWGGINVASGFWFGFWLSMTVAMLAAGLIFAAFGGRQLGGAATAVTAHAGPTILTALVVFVAVPAAAIALMLTLVGIPFGFGVLFFLLPALWFAGYLVAGATLGGAIVGRWIAKEQAPARAVHPYLAVTIGLLILQAIVLIPAIGAAVAFFAGLLGAGALVYRAFTGWRGKETTPRMGAGTPAPAPLG